MRFSITFVLFLLLLSHAYAQVIGPNNPTNVIDGGEGQISEIWSNPNNARSQNDIYATVVTSTKNKRTGYLKAQNFGFNIPAGSTILGIAVEVDRNGLAVAGRIRDSRVRIIDATNTIGSIDKSNPRPWPFFDTDTYQLYGGITDTWGQVGLSPAKINNEYFGVAIMAETSNDQTTFFLFVDEIRITIFYEEGGAVRYAVASGNWSSPSSWSTTPGGPPGASVPSAIHEVYIGGGHTITNDIINAACNSLTIGTTESNPVGNLAVANSNNDLTVHVGGLVITPDGDVVGTQASIITCTGDLTLNKVLTNRNFILRMGAEGTGRSIISGNGSLGNLVVPIFVIHTGNITVTKSLLGDPLRLINSSTAHLTYSGTTNNASDLLLDTTEPGNTVEFSQTTADATNFDIHLLASVFYNLIISGNAPKYYNDLMLIHGDLTITSTGILSNEQEASLILEGNWTNNNGAAGFVPNACNECTVIFQGTNPQTISNSAGEQFHRMEVNKTLSVLSAANDIIVDNQLLMTSGDFDVGANSLTGTANTVFNDGGLSIGTLGGTVPALTGTYTLNDGGITFSGEGNQIIRSSTSAPSITNYRTVRFLGSGTKSLSGSITASKNMVIGATATLDVTASNFGITLGGDWSNTSTFLAHDGTVTLNGVLTQQITNVAGENFANLTINNSASSSAIVLNKPVKVNGLLTLTDGHVISSDTSMMSLGVNATVASVSDGSHVKGPVAKVVSSTSVFAFPIGDGANYMPASITPTSTTNTTFVAEYFPFEYPTGIPPGNQSGIDHVSAQDHWSVQRTSGTADASVTLMWEYPSVGESEVNNLSDLLVAQWNETDWINQGNAGTTGNFVTGTVQSNIITSFTQPYFAIASSSFLNPLSNFRYFSVTSGNWNGSNVWAYRQGGPTTASEPTSNKQAVIVAGNTVTILDSPMDQATKAVQSLTVFGTIVFADAVAQDIIIDVGVGGMTLEPTANIIGTDAGDRIQMSGSITLNNTSVLSHTVLETNFATQGNTITGTGGKLPILNVNQDNQIFTDSTSYHTLVIANNATNNGSITITDNFSGGGILTNSATGTLIWQGTSAARDVINATTPGNTIHLMSNKSAGSVDITAFAVTGTFDNIILDGSNIFTQTEDIDINGNLIIKAGAVFDNASGNRRLNIGGNWINNNGAAGFLHGTNDITFDGSIPQHISISSGNQVFNRLMINNTSSTGVTLTKGQVHVSTSLVLTDGIVFTDATNFLVLQDNATSNAGSAASFVDGPMKKIGNDAFVFPVGDGTIWARLGMETITDFDVTTEYTCQYLHTPFYDLTSLDESVADVSNVEHWLLSRVVDPGSNAGGRVRLFWENAETSGILDLADIRVGRYHDPDASGQKWYNNGGIVTNNPDGSGSVISTSPFSDGPVTFISEFGFALPIELTSFNADVAENRSVALSWKTASELHNDYFTVQRSVNGIEFESLFKVDGAGTSTITRSYNGVDSQPYGGVSYYRLQQTDYDGKSTYSKIVAVSLPENDWSIYPNPSKGSHVQLQVPRQYALKTLVISVIDSRGMIVQKQTVQASVQGRIELSPDAQLSEGVYIINITDGYMMKRMRLIVSP